MIQFGEQKRQFLSVPEGTYTMRIESATLVTAPRTGAHQLEIDFRILSEPAVGERIRRWLDLGNPSALALLGALSRAARVSVINNSLDERDLVGKVVGARVSHYHMSRTGRTDYRVGDFREHQAPPPAAAAPAPRVPPPPGVLPAPARPGRSHDNVPF